MTYVLVLLADTPDVVDEGSVRAYSRENTILCLHAHLYFESVIFLCFT